MPYTVTELSEMTEISESTIRALIHDGLLEAELVSGRYRLDDQEVTILFSLSSARDAAIDDQDDIVEDDDEYDDEPYDVHEEDYSELDEE